MHERTGRDAAVKVIHAADDSDPGWTAALRTEVHALRDLDHPHIVRLVDDSFRSRTDPHDPPWLAMALIPGQSLDAWAQSVPRWRNRAAKLDDDGRTLARLCRPLVQLAEALAYLHAHGIVHRDLKPQNVLMQADDTPVLVDFGLAQALAPDEEDAQLTHRATGSPRFMSPEQFAGASGDARVDLYALGAVMFELWAGRPVFSATTLEALRHQTLTEPAPRLSDFVPSVPGALDRLVERLLEKEPAQRLAHAQSAADVLRQFSGPVDNPRPETARPMLLRGPLRGPLAARVDDVVAHLASQPPTSCTTLCIQGPPGSGRTRLAKEVMHGLIARGHAPVTVRSRHPEALQAQRETVWQVARARPVALLLDDLDTAPPAVGHALETLVSAPEAQACPRWVVIVTGAFADRPPPRLRGQDALPLPLPALSDDDCAQLAADALGGPAPRRVWPVLARDPRPQAVRRRLRGWLDGGWLEPGVAGWRLRDPAAPLPDDHDPARDSWRQDPAARAVIEALAVLDQRTPPHMLAAVLGDPATPVTTTLAALARDELIDLDEDGAALPPGLGHRVYAALPETRRQALHRAATDQGRALSLPEQARHLVGAEMRTQAGTLLRQAASAAGRAGRHTAAHELYAVRAELLDDDGGASALLGAEALAPQGKLDEAAAAFRQARDEAERRGQAQPLLRALLGLADVNRRRGALGTAHSQCQWILDALADADLAPATAAPLRRRGLLLRAQCAALLGRRRDVDRTLKDLDEEAGASAETALLRAWSALSRGDGTAAWAALDGATGVVPPALADEWAIARARASFALGRDDEGRRALAGLADTMDRLLWTARLETDPTRRATAAHTAGARAAADDRPAALCEAGLWLARAHDHDPERALALAARTRAHLPRMPAGAPAVAAQLALLEAEMHLALDVRPAALSSLAEAEAHFDAVDDRLHQGLCACLRAALSDDDERGPWLERAQALAFELSHPGLAARVGALTAAGPGVGSRS